AQSLREIFLLLGCSTAQYDDRRMRIICTDFFENGEPIHFRHPEIKNGDARGLLAEEVQAFDPACRGQHLIAMSGENGLNQLAVHTVIVDNENLDHRSASRTEMPGAVALDRSEIQPNTAHADGEENDGIPPESAQDTS